MMLRCRLVRSSIQGYGTFGVQNQQQSVLELVRAADEFSGGSLQSIGRALKKFFRYLQYIADLINQQAERAVVRLNDHIDRELILRPVL